MPETVQEQGQNRVVDLKAGAHVMMLDAGVFCVFHAPGQKPPGASGLPGVRVTRAPGVSPDVVEISTFESDGWMGGMNGAALVRVHRGPAGVMVTTYQEPESTQEGPRLQVMRLISGVFDSNDASSDEKGGTSSDRAGDENNDITAHIQRNGDVSQPFGEWVGTPGSQLWVEGFSVTSEQLHADDIEYQAVLGRGWLSPWVEGGHFCGSRGMSLPILGLRVRLKGEAATKWKLRVSAAFTDGTRLGPVDGVDDALEAESLAPLEAFRLELLPVGGKTGSASSRKTSTVKKKKPMARGEQRRAPRRR